MLALISHLTLVQANVFPTAITVLSVAGLVAGAAVGAALTHDIALPSQRCFAFEAAEVPHVPVPALGLGALRGEDDLVTGLATRAQALCVVAAAVDFAGMVEVDEVHQQLAARGAHETLWVPAGTQACSAGKHSDVATSDLLPALLTDGPSDGHGEDAHGATAQVLPLPLLAEGSELFLLLLLQCCAVLCLTVVWGQLVQQLLDPVFFPGTVDVGNLILWETAEKLVYLLWLETRGHPGILLRGTA